MGEARRIEALSQPAPDRPASKAPRGFLGMLALILAVEASIAGRRDDLVTPLAESWRVAARAAGREAKGAAILGFGDSLVKYGVLPRVIEARAGLKTYNLATSGGTTPSAFFLLRRALDSGARPRAVVVDFEALMDGGGGLALVRNYPELATAGDVLDLAWSSGDLGLFGALMSRKVLPSCRFRFEIRGGLLAALEGRSSSERASVVSHRTIWARERGAQPTEPGRSHHPLESTLIELVSPDRWSCPATTEAYVDRFFDLAEAHRITVYWLLPPLSPGVRARRVARGSDAAYDRFAQAVAARHPNAVILDARDSGYDDPVHIDHLHLDRRGASVLSADLAAILLEGPGSRASDRLALPPLDGRTGDEPTPAPGAPPTSTARRPKGIPR